LPLPSAPCQPYQREPRAPSLPARKAAGVLTPSSRGPERRTRDRESSANVTGEDRPRWEPGRPPGDDSGGAEPERREEARDRDLLRDASLTLVTAVGALAVLFGVFAVASGRLPGAEPAASRGLNPSPTFPISQPPGAGVTPFGSLPPPSRSLPPATFPSPSAGVDPVLVGAGDIATCNGSGDEATAALLDGIAGTVFTAGDNAYEHGSADDFARCYDPSWGRHRERTRPAPGNHDHETADLAGYLNYFGSDVGTAQEPWYSYDLGAWHVVVLDSTCDMVPGGCDADSPQVDWLRDDLERSGAPCTVAIWHHPRFSSGVHGGTDAVGPFWDVLHEAGAELVINGHDHDYERFAPQAPDGSPDDEGGIRQFIVGTGGGQLRGFPRNPPNSLLRANHTHGVLALTLRQRSYEWAFLAADAIFEDRGSANCH
jgi:hypothetical protein